MPVSQTVEVTDEVSVDEISEEAQASPIFTLELTEIQPTGAPKQQG